MFFVKKNIFFSKKSKKCSKTQKKGKKRAKMQKRAKNEQKKIKKKLFFALFCPFFDKKKTVFEHPLYLSTFCWSILN